MEGICGNSAGLIEEMRLKLASLGWTFTIYVTLLEVYMDTVIDLSTGAKLNYSHKAQLSNKEVIGQARHNIDENQEGLLGLMYKASLSRNTKATAANRMSSRSHGITRIEIAAVNISQRDKRFGIIDLVDLAGSESPESSTNTGETGNINETLMHLKAVFAAMAKNSKLVPYRESALTMILKPSLEEKCRLLMLVTLSSNKANQRESISSLQFGRDAKGCKRTAARCNRENH